MEVTLIYKVKTESMPAYLVVWRVWYNKKQNIFSFTVPAVNSVFFERDLILKTKDLLTDMESIEYCRIIDKQFADNSSVEFCKVVDKKYSDNKCKISFVVKSKGMRFLQSTIQNVDYWED